MLQTDCTISLPCGVNDIKNFTINHCDFYFLDRSGCKLIKWSPSVQTIETISLEQKYLCICYDHREHCYWAIPECKPDLIYRLDACFCQVGHISIKGACRHQAINLCCDDCGKCLWVCYPCQLAHVGKYNGKTTWNKHKDNQRVNLGFSTQCQCRVNCYGEGSREIMEIISPSNGESIEISVPKEYKIVGTAPHSWNHNSNGCRFCILLSNDCLHQFVLLEYCMDFSQEVMKPCCSKTCPSEPCSPKPCPPEPCPPKPCPPEPCPPEPPCGGIYEIMHSIALEEAGISHILNAEGEKIQKAVAMSNDIEQLICVNESVKRTLTQVTLLEGMLYSKLEALVNYHDGCHIPDPEPPCSSK